MSLIMSDHFNFKDYFDELNAHSKTILEFVYIKWLSGSLIRYLEFQITTFLYYF